MTNYPSHGSHILESVCTPSVPRTLAGSVSGQLTPEKRERLRRWGRMGKMKNEINYGAEKEINEINEKKRK
jgi:hypothetical protein